MILLPTIILVYAALTLATPLRSSQRPFSSITSSDDDLYVHDERTKEMEDLLDTYAPVIKLSVKEAYYPSSIEYMLSRYTCTESDDSAQEPINKTLLTPSLLDHFPSQGQGIYLSIPESHNPQPLLLDGSASYLHGPSGLPGGMKRREDGRGIVEEEIYGFWVDMGDGIVDLWYWTFYPFNFGKPIGRFGILGNHVADWEYLRMRTINGSAVSVDYHSHNGGAFSSGTVRWSDVPKIDGRPVAYSATGSHGLWPTPGDHVFANLLNLWRLVDVTDDKGAIWDTKGKVVKSQYWNDPEQRRKLWHKDDRAWLNFVGMWGNKGEDDCWWHKIVGICQLVDSPPGPNRWFGTPPNCVIAPLSSETSSYTFRLSFPAVNWAEEHGVTTVQVDQTCARPRKKKDDSDDDDDDDDASGYQLVDYVHDDSEEEDLEIWSVTGTTEFKGHDKHHVRTLPCSGVKSAVKSYHISLCLADGKCVTTSYDRKLCTYNEGKKGYQFGNAVIVDDIDDWRW